MPSKPNVEQHDCSDAGALSVVASVAVDLRKLSERLASAVQSSPARPANADQLLTAKEAAQRLGMSVDWLYDHAQRLPFTRRVGTRSLRFSRTAIDDYMRRCSQ